MTDREAFEQLLADRGRSISSYTDSKGVTEYADDAAQEDWEVWQAALAYARQESGWIPVPVEPTEEMIEAGDSVAIIHREWGEDIYIENTDAVYRAMLAAAPSAPPTAGERE